MGYSFSKLIVLSYIIYIAVKFKSVPSIDRNSINKACTLHKACIFSDKTMGAESKIKAYQADRGRKEAVQKH